MRSRTADYANLSARADPRVEITPPSTATTKVVSLKPSVTLEPNTGYRLTFRLADAWGRAQYGNVYFTTGN